MTGNVAEVGVELYLPYARETWKGCPASKPPGRTMYLKGICNPLSCEINHWKPQGRPLLCKGGAEVNGKGRALIDCDKRC